VNPNHGNPSVSVGGCTRSDEQTIPSIYTGCEMPRSHERARCARYESVTSNVGDVQSVAIHV
jgi:hypothetical protein